MQRARRRSQRSSKPAEDELDVWKEYLLDDQTHLQQLEGGGSVVGVLQLELGPGVVQDGKEGEVASVAPVATDDEQGAEDGEEDGEGDVEEVEPGVEGEELAAGAQWVASLLREVGVVKVSLLLLLRGIQVAFFLLSREELVLLVIFKLVGVSHIRLGVNSCSHFGTSSL